MTRIDYESEECSHIVIADDEPAILDALSEYLTNRGYTVTGCTNGADALDAVAHHTPDLIVLDISMPRVSGLDAVHRIRFLYGLVDVPVLIITGRDDLATRRLSLHNGADDYLTKPFTLSAFGEKLAALTRNTEPRWLRSEDRYLTPEPPSRARHADQAVKDLASAVTAHRRTVGLIARSLDERSPHGPHHSLQVAELSAMIAGLLHLDARRIKQVRTAGFLHDVGLALLPDTILRNPGPLDGNQRTRVRQHPVLASHMLEFKPYEGQIANAVLHHHERWDGQGYPDGLGEKEIPLDARIVAVADTFAAMTTRTLYAEPLTVPQAAAELREAAGTQLDPEIVEIFTSLIGS